MRSTVERVLRSAAAREWWRARTRHRVLVLTVHGVMDESHAAPWRPLRHRLSPDRLDRCLTLLRQWYTFVPLDEAVDMLAGRVPVIDHAAAITFDDGYRNQVALALPVLERHGVRATVFLSTGHVESRRPFWFDRLDYALQAGAVHGRTVTAGGAPLSIDAASRERLGESFAALRRQAKAPARDDREMAAELEGLADALERESGRRLADVLEDDPWSAVLTADEVRAAAGRVDFGSHTVDHLRVHQLPDDVGRAQLQESRASVEAWTGRRCRTFCYPDGGYSLAAARLVQACGYDAAVTTARGLNLTGDDPFALRRVDLPATGPEDALFAEVSGLKDRVLAWRVRIGR